MYYNHLDSLLAPRVDFVYMYKITDVLEVCFTSCYRGQQILLELEDVFRVTLSL